MDLILCLVLLALAVAVFATSNGNWSAWLALSTLGPVVYLVTGFTKTEADIFVAILNGIAQGMQK
jgi:apolipoprotein N-acyltransferase